MDISRFLDAVRQGCVDPYFAVLYHKDSPSQPAAPDYAGAARATSAGTVQASIANNLMAHPNIYTPLGSQTWSQTGTQTIPGAEGNASVDIPTYQQNVNLTPEGQSLYNQQVGLSTGLMGLGQGALDRTAEALGSGMDTSNLPATVGSLDRNAFDRQKVEDAIYGQAKSRLDPQWDQTQANMEAKLANQGIAIGHEAYDKEIGNFDRAKTDAYQTAVNNAITGAGQEQSRQFGIEQGAGTFQNQARSQALQEQLALRQQPLNELNAIRTGAQPNMPQFQPTQYAMGAQGPNMSGAAGAQGQWDLGQYNAGVGQANSFNSGLMNLGGSIGSAWLMGSDIRLKRDIKRIANDPRGFGIYDFRYLWSDLWYRGVMAQEVLPVIPDAVVMGSNGYLMVDYGRL